MIHAKNSRSLIFMVQITICLLFCECNSFLELENPKTQILSRNIFENENTTNSALAGMYFTLYSNNGMFNGLYTSIFTGLASDELIASGSAYSHIQSNLVPPNDSQITLLWQKAYHIIYQANALIEGVENSEIADAKKKQYIGEALFVRAYTYFYLVNFFGEVPLVLTTNLERSQEIQRTAIEEVYAQIVTDLNNSNLNLSSESVALPDEKVRINRLGVLTFLARICLYRKDWINAEKISSEVISNSDLLKLSDDLNSVFSSESAETIFQIFPNISGITFLGQQFIPQTSAMVPNYYLSNQLLGAFEEGDLRRTNWLDSVLINENHYYFPFKYKLRQPINNLREYCIQFRLAELFLIRAEARIEQGNLINGKEDLDKIRIRAGLLPFDSQNREDLLEAIFNERRIEFFAENGHRWFDLNRRNKIDAVLSLIKPTWKPSASRFPIPEIELNKNPRLIQNDGY